MKIETYKNDTIISSIKDFNLAQTLECGQCFHYKRIDEALPSLFTKNEDIYSTYKISAGGKILTIVQEKDVLHFKNTTKREFEEKWFSYFDFDKNYEEIKNKLSKTSSDLEKIIEENSGIRLLNQDFFECLISFIISQNNKIDRIKVLVKNIAKHFGTSVENEELFLFPTSKQLKVASEEDLLNLKVGFRAKYIIAATKMYDDGKIDEKVLRKASLKDCETILKTINGVGPKVANCVMLFSLGKKEAFPIDVWMKRIMEHLYFDGKEKKKEELEEKAKILFGELGGFAQQYLFMYAKTHL